MRIAVLISTIFLLVGTASAADENPAAIRQAIGSLAPNMEVTDIQPSPVPGLYQVTLGTQVVYMTGDGRYLVQGSVFDTQKRQDITESARADLRQQALAKVDPADEITFAPPADKIRHEVTVFTDIDCPYCRRFHSQIDEYNKLGIAVHYLAFPRAGLNSHSYEKAVSVWCADDPKAALTEAKQGNEPSPKSCDNPVKDEFMLGQKVGINGTPAIIASDGTMLPGYMPPDALSKRLDQIAASDKQATRSEDQARAQGSSR